MPAMKSLPIDTLAMTPKITSATEGGRTGAMHAAVDTSPAERGTS